MGPEAEEAHQGEEDPRTLGGASAFLRDTLASLEAVLFMAAEPLSASEIGEILGIGEEEADALVGELSAQYEGRGIQVSRIAGGYQVCTRPEYGRVVAKLHEPERFRLSRAALETLAIVAYRQPVTRPEIDTIRGVNSDSPVETLLQYELICEGGRKEAPGRPIMYRTTEGFLGHFGLNSVADLPQLEAVPVAEREERVEAAGEAAPESAGGPAGEGGEPDTEEQPGG